MVSSTSPTLPSSTSTTEITINFSRALSSSEQSAFSATLKVASFATEVQSSWVQYNLARGFVSQSTTTVGEYSFTNNGSSMVITLSAAKYPKEFFVAEAREMN